MTTTASQRERFLRIGEVVRRLTADFPDISISKIRYLEDEGLLTPRRTQGGYRLFSEADLERLQTIRVENIDIFGVLNLDSTALKDRNNASG